MCLLETDGAARSSGAAADADFGDDRPAFILDGFGHDEHGLEVHDAGDAGDIDPDQLPEMVEVPQCELDHHVELPGDVVTGAHAGHGLYALLERHDGALAVLPQARDHEGAHGDPQDGGVDDGAIAADGAAPLKAPDAPEHR